MPVNHRSRSNHDKHLTTFRHARWVNCFLALILVPETLRLGPRLLVFRRACAHSIMLFRRARYRNERRWEIESLIRFFLGAGLLAVPMIFRGFPRPESPGGWLLLRVRLAYLGLWGLCQDGLLRIRLSVGSCGGFLSMPRFISKHPVEVWLASCSRSWKLGVARDVVFACPTCIGQSTPWTFPLQCVVWQGVAMTVTSSAVVVGAVHYAR
jgi:hypothetical protein